MKKRLPFIFMGIIIIAGLLIWFKGFKDRDDPGLIRVSGNIEATQVQLGFKIAGRLEKRMVDEGDIVTKGEVIALLENTDQKILTDLAKASLARARAVLAELEAGSRPGEIQQSHARVLQARQVVLELTRGSRAQEIKTAVSNLDTAMALEKSARIQLVQAKKDYERFSKLYREKTASRREFELFETQYDIARSKATEAEAKTGVARQALSLIKEGPRKEQIEKAKAALLQAEAEYSLIKEGPRKEKIEQANAVVIEAEGKLNQAKQQLSYTRLLAPMSGVILSKSAEPGEYLNPGTPVVILGDLAHPWLRAFITEKDLGRLRLRDTVTVTTDSFPDKKYQGVLTFISSQAEFTPKSVQTFEERVKLMYRIKIELANHDGELKPGMPADAVISVPVK